MSLDEARPTPIRWRWIAALWCAAAAFEACQSIFMLHSEGKHSGEVKLLLTEFVTWTPWMLATPLVISLARRYPVFGKPSWRGAGVHVLVLLAITLVAEGWSAGLQVVFNPWVKRHTPEFWDTWNTTLIYQALNCLAAYLLILTITHLVDSRQDVARQAAESARLNEELSRAQLAALRRQMEPHFMFNTLNAIAGLVRDNRNTAAVNMIAGLSEFLRRATQDAERHQVALAEEAEYLESYVAIQRMRFGERLQVDLDIRPDTLDLAVPSLLLQPLVENAIKHGLSHRAAGGRVRVSGARQGRDLRLAVYNDGPPFPPDWEGGSAGVGLLNLRTRLRILYGEASQLQVRNCGTEGVEVVVTLPAAEA